jgi:hypothetical protein
MAVTRTDKATVLAAERQEPYTAAEHAAASGHMAEFARDIPRSCACAWAWEQAGSRYVMIARVPGCPWHNMGVTA